MILRRFAMMCVAVMCIGVPTVRGDEAPVGALAQLMELKAELEAQKSAHGKLKAELEAQKSAHGKLKAEVDTLKTELGTLKTQMNEMDKQYGAARSSAITQAKSLRMALSAFGKNDQEYRAGNFATSMRDLEVRLTSIPAKPGTSKEAGHREGFLTNWVHLQVNYLTRDQAIEDVDRILNHLNKL